MAIQAFPLALGVLVYGALFNHQMALNAVLGYPIFVFTASVAYIFLGGRRRRRNRS
jgi:hypothetical protein